MRLVKAAITSWVARIGDGTRPCPVVALWVPCLMWTALRVNVGLFLRSAGCLIPGSTPGIFGWLVVVASARAFCCTVHCCVCVSACVCFLKSRLFLNMLSLFVQVLTNDYAGINVLKF